METLGFCWGKPVGSFNGLFPHFCLFGNFDLSTCSQRTIFGALGHCLMLLRLGLRMALRPHVRVNEIVAVAFSKKIPVQSHCSPAEPFPPEGSGRMIQKTTKDDWLS